MKHLRHHDLVIIDNVSRYPKKGSVGTVRGCAIQYNEDPNEAETREKQMATERPYQDRPLFWINQEAGMLCGDPGYYEQEKARWANAIHLQDGEIIEIEGHVLKLKYKGDYSNMGHFTECRPTDGTTSRDRVWVEVSPAVKV